MTIYIKSLLSYMHKTYYVTVKQSHNILLTLWIHWGCKKNKVGVVNGYTGFAIFIIHQNCNSEQ